MQKMRALFYLGVILVPPCQGQVLSVNALNSVVEVTPTIQAVLNSQQTSINDASSALNHLPATPQITKLQAELQDSGKAVATAQASAVGIPATTKRDRIISEETIRTATRPVFALCNSAPWVESQPYTPWEPYISPLQSTLSVIAPSVGMFVYYDQSGGFISRGATAFLIKENFIVTNRHVLALYADVDGDGVWHLKSDRSLRVEFPLEVKNCKVRYKTREVKVSSIAVVGVDPIDDFAILQLDPSETGLPQALIPSENSILNPGLRVLAIGYPGLPEACGMAEPTDDHPCTFLTGPQIDLMFRTPDKQVPFPAERISPGFVLYDSSISDERFSYDSSTWGGSSGSPIVSIADGSVVGIQSQGITYNADGVSYNRGVSISRLLAYLKNLGTK